MRIWRAGSAVALDFEAARFERPNAAIFNAALSAAKGVAPRTFAGVTRHGPAQKRQRRRDGHDTNNCKFSHRIPPLIVMHRDIFPRWRLFPGRSIPTDQLGVKPQLPRDCAPALERGARPRLTLETSAAPDRKSARPTAADPYKFIADAPRAYLVRRIEKIHLATGGVVDLRRECASGVAENPQILRIRESL